MPRFLYRSIDELSRAERALLLREAALNYCYDRRMVATCEIGLPSGAVADVLGVRFNGVVTIIEIKSCRADFIDDQKWTDYARFADYVYFFAPPGAIAPDDLPPGIGLYELVERKHRTLTGRTSYRRKLVSRRPVSRTGANAMAHAWKYLFRMADRHTRHEQHYPAPETDVELPPPQDTPEAEPVEPVIANEEAIELPSAVPKAASAAVEATPQSAPSSQRVKPRKSGRRTERKPTRSDGDDDDFAGIDKALASIDRKLADHAKSA